MIHTLNTEFHCKMVLINNYEGEAVWNTGLVAFTYSREIFGASTPINMAWMQSAVARKSMGGIPHVNTCIVMVFILYSDKPVHIPSR